MWLLFAISAASAGMWGITEGHKLYRAKFPHQRRRSAVSPKATVKSTLCFTDSDASAIEALLTGSKARTLKIEQDGTSGTLQLTIKRGAK